MPIKGTYYNATLGSAPTLNTQLGFKRLGVFPTTPSAYTASTVVSNGNTINLQQVSLEPGSWLLIASGRNAIPTGTITFNYPYTLRYNITSASQTYANADAYHEFVNVLFPSSISILPTYNFSVYVQPTITTDYYVTCSPLYGDGTSTTFGTNIQIGTENKFMAIRVG
jgi:hypothetical protein